MQATRRSLFPPVQSGWTLDFGLAFLHHFCTVSSPIFAPFGEQSVANQQLTIQNCTIGTDTARVVSSATFSHPTTTGGTRDLRHRRSKLLVLRSLRLLLFNPVQCGGPSNLGLLTPIFASRLPRPEPSAGGHHA